MSFRNVYFDKKKNKIHHWYTIKGKKFYDTVDWVPYLFIPSANKNSDWKSPNGDLVEKKYFNSYYEYKDFAESKKSIVYENNLREEIQFLVDTYHKIPDDDLEVPDLKIIFFDAEMDSVDGTFPSASEGKDPITLITAYNSSNDKMYGWGIKPYTGKNKKLIYQLCDSPQQVLELFILFIHKESPDILTGWNILGFDLEYFYNYAEKYLKPGFINKLSPVNRVSAWKKGDIFNIDIVGITIIDYLPLFKQFYQKKLARYGLDPVSKHLFSKGKLDFSEFHENLHDLCENNWDMYVDYCVEDTWRVKRIDDKCKFINLVQALSLLTKCPMKYYEQVTTLIEGIFLTYYRRNGMCTHRFVGGERVSFPAALVKKTKTGKHKWVVDVDVTSSYPYSMIALNMGTNTYIGKIKTIQFVVDDYNNGTVLKSNINSFDELSIPTEEDILNCTRNKNFPPFYLETDKGTKKIIGKSLELFNKAVKNKEFSIAPNGSIFTNKIPGDIATIEKYLFLKRKHTNDLLSLEKENENNEDRILELNCKQIAIKNVLNSIYGALAVPYFRAFNINIATAITACGRNNWLAGSQYVNEFLNSNAHTDIDYIIAGDTDSHFVELYSYIINTDQQKEFDLFTKDRKIDRILEISKELEKYVNEKCFTDLQLECYNSVEKDFKISFKQEVVAETSIFLAKKKYTMWIVSDKGHKKEEMFSRGIELVRSDTPEVVKPILSNIVEMLLKETTDDELKKKIFEYETELMSTSPSEIATNISCSDINKYQMENFKARKGTPMHIKGAINYRYMLKEFNLQKLYEDIVDHTKVKVVYLKPNKFSFESLSFTRWPKELESEGIQVDYNKMIEKYFFKKIEMFLEVLNKKDLTNKNNVLIDMFF